MPYHEYKEEIILECKSYLLESFGSSLRLDYGTGHELSFICFLIICEKINVWQLTEMAAISGVIFKKWVIFYLWIIYVYIFCRYLELVRKLQITYQLEPAGSHGVWGLDDYQFLPYLWGSSQLIGKITKFDGIDQYWINIYIGKEDIIPTDIVVKESHLKAFAPEYLYLDAVNYIYHVNI